MYLYVFEATGGCHISCLIILRLMSLRGSVTELGNFYPLVRLTASKPRDPFVHIHRCWPDRCAQLCLLFMLVLEL